MNSLDTYSVQNLKLGGHDTSRWKNVFAVALRKVSSQVNPGFGIQPEALDYVEDLIISLLLNMIEIRPHSLSDIEQHVQKTFPEPINEWAVNEAHEVVTKSGRRNKDKPVLPWREVQTILKEILSYKLDNQVVMYLIAVLEYIAADILKLTGNYVKNIRHTEITFQDLKVAMRADSVLMEMFFRDEDETTSTTFNGWVSNLNQQSDDYGNRVKVSLSYEDTVKDLIHDETQYLRDVNMIVLVFRSAFEKIAAEAPPNSNRVDLDLIFSNILDVREFTARFLGSLEETVEMTREGSIPEIGNCFSEMAQAMEFQVYDRYAEEILMSDCLDHLNSVLNWSHVKENFDHQAGFRLAAKYVLPKLLLIPIFHCLTYFEYLSTLKNLKSSENDRSDLKDSDSYLFLLKTRLDQHYTSLMRRKFSGQFLLRLSGHNQTAIAKIQELTKSVDGWDSRIDGRNCSEFILEGNVGKLNTMQQTKLTNTLLGPSDTLRSSRNRTTERYIYLFDNLIVLCKSSQSRRTTGGGGSNDSKFKLKEFFQIRRIEVVEREDTDDLKYSFELKPKNNQPSIVLFCKSQDDKQNWMAALVMLQARSMLERKLDAALAEEENRIPLLLPCVEQYKFAEKDLEDVNIKFENYSSSSGMPIVKAATVPKLIERLTHHQQVDPNFTKMFLMTYRSFCEPNELLDLLIERFDIKDPSAFDVSNGLCGVYANGTSAAAPDPSSPVDSDLLTRDALKKFRKKYAQPIQIRVLNVMRHWFDGHWYDFEQDPQLLELFKNFLKRVEDNKHIKKWVKNFLEIIVRKEEAARNGVEDAKTNMVQIFNSDPPPLEWHIAQNPEHFDLMTLHPVEIARQVTLLEFDLYRAVKPIELVDAAWTKKDKSRSPQLTKLMKHSTNFNYWLQNCILECGNVDERIAVTNRILEIMSVFEELNNFNGLIEIHGVMQSSPIFRLSHTIEKLDKNLWKKYNEVEHLLDDRRHRKIQFKLKSINPPCVPFFGTYLTELTYVNEAGKFFTLNVPLTDKVSDAAVTDVAGGDGPNLSNKQMINVVKCRKTANIISEIQLYQDAPYCLRVEPSIRHFFETLNPLEDFNDNPNDFQTYLYERSLVVEPKNCDRPIYNPPKRELSQLKSPGIRHLKQNMKVKNSVNVPSTPLFTPLQNYGKDKPPHLHSSSHTTNTAPASPTSSKESALFSIIEIEQGQPPRYIADVPSSRRGDFTTSPSGSATLPNTTRSRTNSNPSSISGGPPIPPRHTTLGRTPKHNSSSEISPPLPPKPRDNTKSASPRSPLTGPRLNNGGSDFGPTFKFPDPSSGPGRPPSKSPPPSLQPLLVSRPNMGPAPEIPPRKTIKTPLPHLSTRSAPPPLPSGSSWSTDSPPPTAPLSSSSTSSQFTTFTSPFVRVDGALNGTSTTPKPSSSSPPPPLPPRARLVSPPPLPPKRGSIQPQPAPPLPPKTYKSKSRFDDSENEER